MSEPSHAASPRFVKCPGCGAKLGVRAEDAGQRGQCHQCGKVFRIGGPPPQTVAPTPTASFSAPTPRRGLGDYDNDHLHPVSCLVCQTLMYATDEQVGTKVKCPDCGAMNLAKRREAKKAKPSPLVADGDEYQLDESSIPPPTPRYTPIEEREAQYRAAALDRLGRRPASVKPAEPGGDEPSLALVTRREAVGGLATQVEPQQARKRADAKSSRRPLVPVVQGVWAMMFTPEVMVRWFALSIILMTAVTFISVVTNALGNQAIYLLPVFAKGCIVGGFWLLSAASLLVAILTQSANGADELSEPPSWLSIDVGELGFVAIGAMLSAAPAWLATRLTRDWPWEANLAIGAGIWLATFPFVMLSALEQGSPLAFFSPRLAASIGRCFVPWLAYYAVASALAAGTGFLCWKMIGSSNPVAMLPLAWLVTAVLLLYVRIVGRLGWWISDLTPPREESE